MQFTITLPNDETVTRKQDAPYYDSESKTVYSNDRQRLMPRIARQLIPEGFYPTGVTYQGSLVYDNPEPPELEEAPQVRFTVRDETGGKCVVHARRDDDHIHSIIRKAARFSAQEAFSHLPDTEPERTETADPSMPDGFWPHEVDHLEENLDRPATDEEKEIYRSTWEGRYEELMVEDGIARNIQEARS